MSDVSIPQPSRPRPATVTAAATLMIFMGVAGIVSAVVSLAGIGGVVDRFRSAAEGTGATQDDIDGLATLAQGTTIFGAVLAIVVAVLLVVLAMAVLRGSSGARIATWVVSGLGLLCGCCGLFAVIFQSALSWNISSDDQVAENLTQALTDAYPGWWIGLNGGLSAAQALGYLVVALLLALPASHPYFRKTAPAPAVPPLPPPPPEVRESDWQPPAQP
jgi:hypothetical protein